MIALPVKEGLCAFRIIPVPVFIFKVTLVPELIIKDSSESPATTYPDCKLIVPPVLNASFKSLQDIDSPSATTIEEARLRIILIEISMDIHFFTFMPNLSLYTNYL